jgi:hypothetical protein
MSGTVSNKTLELIQLLGSPFVEQNRESPSEEYLLSMYDQAFKDRVALLLLEKYKRSDWGNELLDKYQKLFERQRETFLVIARLGRVLNEFDPESYVIFKSIKPYPATPNDTDVIFLKGKKEYEKAYRYLLDAGYVFHEWAPQQRTVYDPKGLGKIGIGKKGGTYYIDLYEEISTDYFAYFDKHQLLPHIVIKHIEGIPVRLLSPEPELAIILFHNVFPERTFQLEHFYLPLYYLSSKDFDADLFIEFVRNHGMVIAVKTNFTIVAHLHNVIFGNVPYQVQKILLAFGQNGRELVLFQRKSNSTPYLFSQNTFWLCLFQKATELYCFRSLLIQFLRMLYPPFFIQVVRSLRNRLSEKGIYHLE